jgi:hypothetical protein
MKCNVANIFVSAYYSHTMLCYACNKPFISHFLAMQVVLNIVDFEIEMSCNFVEYLHNLHVQLPY